MTASENNLIWIDLEMTGLNTQRDSILEIATIVTDSQLNELAQGPALAISHPPGMLEAMDDWNTRHHTRSGLWQRVLDSTISMELAEKKTLKFLQEWVVPDKSPMCGNSICQDRRFLARQMPKLEKFFHYRNLDVSTLKELAHRWVPEKVAGYSKESRHEALSDIRESIEELKFFRSMMGELGGLDAQATK